MRFRSVRVPRARLTPVVLALATVTACASGTARSTGPAHQPARTAASGTASPPPTEPSSAAASPPGAATTGPTPVPPVSGAAHADGLIDVRTVVPDAVIDLRYATADNFTHVQLYPSDARCLVHRSMAAGLTAAAQRLRAQGYVLVFWDCYRPHAVQVRMFQVVPDPAWVARPGPYARSHEAGRSVDVTLARVAPAHCGPEVPVAGHCLLDMGTDFDDFTARAHAFATAGVSPQAQQDRAVLRDAMAAGGLQVYTGEWWHFDGPGAAVERPILSAPVD